MQLNTLSDLEERKAQREKALSEYNKMLNDLKAKRDSAEKESKKAITDSDIDKAVELSKVIQEIDFRSQAIIGIIEATNAKPICTDAECIQIANNILAKYKPTISKLKERFNKLANDICSTYRELAVTYEKAYEEKHEILVYHSATKNKAPIVAEQTIEAQGLEPLEPMPPCNDIFGLLNRQFGVSAETIRAISNGIQMTGFRG